jgi:5'-nucleotidase
VELLLRGGLEAADRALILNVNVPNLPLERLRGFRSTRLGFRHPSERVQPALDPKGRQVYWVGRSGGQAEAGPGTDFHAVNEGYVSVTPLQIDLTRHAALPTIERWLGALDD